jgi:predicted CXXCH cytochrome family protein
VKKIRAFGEKGQEIPWKRVWRLPPHVFFPHRTHVVVAKLKCQTCHGPMETLDRPPARALKTLTMNDCIGCHEQWERPPEKGTGVVKVAARRVSTDCNTCHR